MKNLRTLLIRFKLDRVVRFLDTAVHVYTAHSATLIVSFTVIILNLVLHVHPLIDIITASIISLSSLHLGVVLYSEKMRCANSTKKFFVNLEGGFVSVKKQPRKLSYDLGVLIEGETIVLRLLVHLLDEPEADNVVLEEKYEPTHHVRITKNFTLNKSSDRLIKTYFLQIYAVQATNHKNKIDFTVKTGGSQRIDVRLLIEKIVKKDELKISKIAVDGWKSGRKAAFVWRGDVDALNPRKSSDEPTLSKCLNLSHRYGVPLTLFISGRLTLDEEQWSRFALHYQLVDHEEKAQTRFNEFLSFLKKLKVNQNAEYPVDENTISVGNHSYLHHGGIHGAADFNGWDESWRLGEGKKEWLASVYPRFNSETMSFNQLNTIINNQLIKQHFGVEPKSWAAPRNETVSTMAKELEEVGILYASEADDYPRISKTFFPRRPKANVCHPYHPKNCERLVESRCVINPLDPTSVHDVVSIIKSIQHAVKTGKQLTLLMHPHLRMYSNRKSIAYVARVLEYLCENADQIWLTTHESMLAYWENVRCPKHAVIKIKQDDGIFIVNESNQHIESVPVSIKLSNGDVLLRVVDLGPRQTVKLF